MATVKIATGIHTTALSAGNVTRPNRLIGLVPPRNRPFTAGSSSFSSAAVSRPVVAAHKTDRISDPLCLDR
ncbi:MAG: hypothetical protein ACJAVC_000096 [Brevundimonas sp.]|jgi:hypothetical protein